MAISLLFWLTLLAAAAVFAAVSLSPKLATYLALCDEFRAQQEELVELEQQHAELERVIAALKNDPQFVAELARLEFDAVRPGEEILSVDSSLTLAPRAGLPRQQRPSTLTSPWRPWVAVVATSRPLRSTLLLSAAILVLFAFGWLHTPGDQRGSPAAGE
jgi:cell division protein FtsB